MDSIVSHGLPRLTEILLERYWVEDALIPVPRWKCNGGRHRQKGAKNILLGNPICDAASHNGTSFVAIYYKLAQWKS